MATRTSAGSGTPQPASFTPTVTYSQPPLLMNYSGSNTNTNGMKNGTTANVKHEESTQPVLQVQQQSLSSTPINHVLAFVKTQSPSAVMTGVHNSASEKYRDVKTKKQEDLRYKVVEAQRNGDKNLVKIQKKKNDNHASAVASRVKQDYIVKLFETKLQQSMTESKYLANAYISQAGVLKKCEEKNRALIKYIELLEAKLHVLRSNSSSSDNESSSNNDSSSGNVNVPENTTGNAAFVGNSQTNTFATDSNANTNTTAFPVSNPPSSLQHIDGDFHDNPAELVHHHVYDPSTPESIFTEDLDLYSTNNNAMVQFEAPAESMSIAANDGLFKEAEFSSLEPLYSRRPTNFRALFKSDDAKDEEFEAARAA